MISAGLYLHSPFCVHKCGYCDFNSWAEEGLEPQNRWLRSIEKQIDFWSEELSLKDVIFNSVFFGGGTPSLLDDKILIRLGEKLKKSFRMSEDCEFSVEANPETLNLQKLEALKALGANRLSMGVQSFKNSYLKILERKASRESVIRSLELVRANWKGRFSFDLMFGLPEQKTSDWIEDLSEALSWDPSHISCYQLTLGTQRSLKWKQASEDILLEMTERGEEILEAEGLRKYEVSNFARPGMESRHNIKYWKLEPFLGLGPGASGLLAGRLLQKEEFSRFGAHQKQPDSFEIWEQGVGIRAFELQKLKRRAAQEHLEEMLMMGLRLREGLLKARLPEVALKALADFEDMGFIEDFGHNIRCTERGERLLDGLLPRIFSKIEEIAGGELDSAQIDPTF